VGELYDVEQADVPLPALGTAYILPMEFCKLSKLLPRQFAFLS